MLPQSLQQKFELNRKKVFNIVVFTELLKALACALESKQTVSQLLVTNQLCKQNDAH